MNRKISIVLVGLAILVAAALRSTPATEPEQKKLVVCAVPAAMPRTGKASDGSAQGLDVAAVRLLGEQLGRNIEFHWCASASCSWSCLRSGRCDLIIGLPHGSGDANEFATHCARNGAAE